MVYIGVYVFPPLVFARSAYSSKSYTKSMIRAREWAVIACGRAKVSYLTSDDVFPVVLCKAEKSHETQLDLDSLSELGLDPKKALIVANYFNKQIGDFSAVSELNTYCSGYQAKYPQIRFVMLQPQDGINKDGMKFQELSDYYENLAEKEKQALDQHVERMEKDVRLKPSVTKNIGVTSAFDFMHAQLHRWMQDNRDRIRDALQDKPAASSSPSLFQWDCCGSCIFLF